MSTMQNPDQPTFNWQDGQPHSALFDDIYFSRESGLEESRHVFLQHNDLPRRWQQLQGDLFTVAETGFGTGLNFLCAWQLWRATAPVRARLHFVSTERYPLSRDELAQSLALWPELSALSSQLLAQYDGLSPGWQRFSFDEGHVTLTLLIGDARNTLTQLRANVDAWFLDGFAPAKNPEMWAPDLLQTIADCSAPGCSFATFTSAGAVRRGLQAAGFEVRKVAGFGRKREMLCGSRPGPASSRGLPGTAVVIGGGIAGTATAHSLARRGWQVTLIERDTALARAASGNPQGILYPRLSGHDIPLSRVALQGFLHTLRLLPSLLEKGRDWNDCGLLQLAFNEREAKRCREVLARALPPRLVQPVDAATASSMAAVDLPYGGLFFPQGGWVNPPAFCHALSADPLIAIKTATRALKLDRVGDGWQVQDETGTVAVGAVVVICGANDSAGFRQTAHLPLEPVRGQITQLPATAGSARLKTVVCTDGYISPAHLGHHCLGATFEPDDRSLLLRSKDHRANLDMLRVMSPRLFAALEGDATDTATLAGRVGLRCVSPDYLPMAGPLLDPVLLEERYSIGSRASAAQLPWLRGLYVNTAHGSKGMITAPLCAEIIAASLTGEPMPVDAGLVKALDPNRFLLRERGLKRLIGSEIS